jgi:hypothetical protein
MPATVTGWIAYASASGVVIADDADSAAALVRASRYIQRTFLASRMYTGIRDDIAEQATYEAAALELATPGFWSRTFTPDQQKSLVAVGDLKWQVTGNASGADGATPVSTAIDAMMQPYRYIPFGAMAV